MDLIRTFSSSGIIPINSTLDTGLALSPVFFGPLLDAGRFREALVAVAVLQVAALTTAWRVGGAARAVALRETA